MSCGPVLILGARSGIARAVAQKFASLGHPLQLAARNVETMETDKADLELRHGVTVTLHEFDVLAAEAYDAFVRRLPVLPDITLCAVGYLGDQKKSERDTNAATEVMRSNFEGPANILAILANRFEERGSGTLVGISSAAGERGRASNYVYGSAKAGLTAFLSGLRNRLAKKGVHVVTVLPGFVATQMTEGMDLPTWLTAQPEEVADRIVRAVRMGHDIVYVRRVMKPLMIIIRNIPEKLFKRMSI